MELTRRNDSFHHGREGRLVFRADILKLQTDTDAGKNVAHGSFGDDPAIFDEEVEFNGGVDGEVFAGLDEDATNAHIADARGILGATATPKDPDTIGSVDTLVLTTRFCNLFLHVTNIRT